MQAERALFLPGASGVARFWQPVIDELSLPYEHIAFDYPGYGGNPPDPKRSSLSQLTAWIETYIDRPVDIVAQSMGGAIALALVLRHHDLVRHLVLTATTAGVHVDRSKAENVRASRRVADSTLGSYLSDEGVPLIERIASLPVPGLLIAGTRDGVAPLAQIKALAGLLPDGRLVAIDTDSHFFVRERPGEVAPHIRDFLLA
jgi:pimeloyl-ACP methyl ester carboxylesterase